MHNNRIESDDAPCGFAPRRKLGACINQSMRIRPEQVEIHSLDELINKFDTVQRIASKDVNKDDPARRRREEPAPPLPATQAPQQQQQCRVELKDIPVVKTDLDIATSKIMLPITTPLKFIKKTNMQCSGDDVKLGTKLIEDSTTCIKQQQQQQQQILQYPNSNMVTEEELINNNCIGLLQNMCMNHHWPPPTYETVSESGMPHERIFTMACKIVNFKEIGSGKTKKIGRHIAAHKMLMRLHQMPNELETISLSSIKSNAESRNSEIMRDIKTFDFVALLDEISIKNHFTVGYVKIEKELSGLYACIGNNNVDAVKDTGIIRYIVQVSTMPVGICLGIGADAEEAKQDAARNALDFIKLLVKRKV